MRWGTITATAPLRVRLDGDTDPLPFTPDSLVDPLELAVNDRVRCEISGRVVIIGKAGGLPLPLASTTDAGIVELATPAETVMGRQILRANLCANPSFETNAVGWTSFNGATLARSTTRAHTASASLLVTRTASTDDFVYYVVSGLTPGDTYTGSFYVYLTGDGATFSNRGILVFGGSGGGIGQVDYDRTKINQWQRVSATAVIGTSGTFEVRAYAMTGFSLYVDAVQIEAGPAASGYFDGNTPDAGGITYSWAGTANNSVSYETRPGNNLAVTPAGLVAWGGRPMVPSSVVVGSGSASFATDGTVTFTEASSVSLNDVFVGVAGMDEYRVVWRLITSDASAINARLRTPDGNDSVSGYDNQRLTALGTTATPTQSLNISEIILSGGTGGADARHYGSLELTAPTWASLPTLFRVSNVVTPAAMTSAYGTYYGGGQRRAGPYAGITLFASVGTISGVAKVVKLG